MHGQIDLLSEKPIPIKVFSKEVPGRDGKPVHWITLGRWTRQGLRGVVLESLVIGNQRCVTRESFARFVEAVTARANGEPRPAQTVPHRSRREAARDLRNDVAFLKGRGA
jgi:hypothetical protein